MSQPNPQPVASTDTKIWIYLAYIFSGFFGLLGLIGLAVVKDDEHVRFHCAQAFAFGVAWAIVNIILTIIPIIGWVLMPLVSLGAFIYALIVMMKAAKGEHYKMPVVGDFAEKNLMKLFK
jgi:uncharacterized membrane protein